MDHFRAVGQIYAFSQKRMGAAGSQGRYLK